MSNPVSTQRCEIHGRPLRGIDAAAACPACLATTSCAAIAEFEDLQDSIALRQIEKNFTSAHVPPLFTNATFASFVPANEKAKKISDALAAYVANFEEQRMLRPGFVFSGNPGTGKTHLACAMVNGLLDLGYKALYMSLPEFTLQARKSFKDNRLTVADMVKDASGVDFLVIDEIDLHGSSDMDYQMLYEIINDRYESQGRPTLALTNRPVSELIVDLDERLITRILGATNPVIFDWQSRRTAGAPVRQQGAR